MVISAPNVEKTSYNNKIKLWAYVDGDYAFSKETTGYSAACGKKAMLDRVAFNISKSVANGDESCHYAFGLDNFVINAYTNYTPTTDNNLKSFMAAGGKGSLSSLDDVLFNEDYISPNGNSFTLDWVDLSGDKIFSEQQKLGGTPSADKSELDGGSYMGVKGNYKNLAAWEWNVSEDADVFTPVSSLTLDNVKTVRARGSKSITVRPAVIDVDWVDDEGSSVGVEQYFAGSTVESFNTATNGWYSLEYFAIKNATEGEAEDSFIAVYGKENKFVVDDSFATPTASISGIRYNMSLLTNYYMNIYVPNDTPENVELLGFYAEETLENKYTTGTRTVSIGGTVYRELSFGVANSDIDVNLPKYVGIKVTLGGEEHLIAYKVSVNALSYSKGVLDVYGCESNEARLVVNLLNYANEAYKLVKGEANSSALSILAEHSECGCILSGNVDDEYKGSVDTLSGYLYGAAYNVTSAQPSMMLYLLSSKASEVTGIRVSYDGIEGEKSATLTALPEISIDGKSVIPYSYSTISASDVNEVMTVTVLGEDGMPLANGTYALANYAFNNDVKVANALFAFSKAAAAYKKSVIGAPESPSVIEGITAYKTSNLRPSTTLDNGHTIIYTISVTNNNPSAITVPVNDRIPANTLYVSGAESVRGFDLSWNLDVPAGGTVSVSYVVRVDSNKNLLNRVSIKAPTAVAGGVEAECNGENYVKRTLNAIDREFIDTGINAISFTENIAPVDAVKMMYNVAFSKYFTMSGSISDVISAIFESTETSAGVGYRKMVIPTLYGGSSLSSALDSRFVGERAEAIAIGDLIEGDILFIRDSEGSKMYICDSDGIVSLTNGYERVSASQVVDAANSANYYAALRPSMVMSTRVPFEFYGDDSDLTDEQIALVETAKSYILRGYRLQYDDGGMADYSEYRWQIGKYELEEYTSQKWG